jgi:beta-lactamase superfamily II metal-dependent hydrolase
MSFSAPYVAILDVGHGNSTVIKDTLNTVIIDCGARGSGLLEFLKKENIFEINSVFLSHADQDHIGGLIGLLSSGEFIIHSVYVNSDSSKGSIMWDDLTYELSQLSEKGEIKFQVGITRDLGILEYDSIHLKVVGPTGYLASKGAGSNDRLGRTINSNSISASFQVIWKDKIIAYLSGDIDQIGLDDIVAHGVSISSNLLVFPHHGGNNEGYDNISFTQQLCTLTNPETVIFSIGRNKHDNPRPEIISTVRSTLPNVRISCTQLSKNCAKNVPLNSSQHLIDLYSKGKENNICCSGTFLIQLGDSIEHFPELASHRLFISESTDSSMCVD